MKSSPFSSRLMAVMFLLGTAPLVPAGGLLYYYQSRAKINILALHESLSAVAADTIWHYLRTLAGRLEFAERLELSPDARDAARVQLEQALLTNADILSIAALSKNGAPLVRASRPGLADWLTRGAQSANPVFTEAVRTGQVVFSGLDSMGGAPVCSLALPLKNGNYLYMLASMEPLWRQIQEQRIGKTGRILVTDGQGRIFRFGGDNPPIVFPVVLQKLFSAGPAARLEYVPSLDGVFVGAYRRVPETELYVATLQSRSEAFWTLRVTMLLMAGFLLLAATASYFLSRRYAAKLSEPVAALIDGASRVARKNFDTPVKSSENWGEFRGLILAFNSMMAETGRYSRLQVDKVLEEKHKMDLLISMMSDGVVLADDNCQPVFMNRIAQELLADPQFRALAVDGAEETVRHLCRREGESDQAYAVQLSGGTRWFRVTRQRFQPSRGEAMFLIALRDVTLEHELDAVKEEFFNSVAHDLRAPLLGMQGYIRLLEASVADPKGKEIIYSMKTVSSRVFRLVEDILDVARMESGTLRLKSESFDIEECVSRAVISLAPLVAEKKIELSARLLPGASGEFFGDVRMMERALVNLISNSVKYTPQGGRITVSYGMSGGIGEVRVKDSGPGIPPARMGEIFKKFHRLDETHGGYGLGLATVRKIVEMHGGQIRAGNGADGGAEFSFTIPGQPPKDAPRSAPPA
ncbi:MAG: ATP-binding protein [Elusimicrobiales bacterium]